MEATLGRASIAACTLACLAFAFAAPASGAKRRPSLAPIGVPADVVLARGEWRIAYRYLRSDFSDLRNGGADRKPGDVFASGFPQAPIRMLVEEHQLALSAAPHDRLTLRALLPWREAEMALRVQGSGVPFTVHAQGLGDLRVGLIHEFMVKGDEHLQLLLDLVVPTGTIRASDTAPQGRERVPYALRPAAGSWGLEPGLNYQGRAGPVGWGGRATTLFLLADNGLGYRHGNRYEVTGWISQAWTEWFSTSQRLEWAKWGNVHDSDENISLVSPANDTKAQGGERLDLAAGFELAPPIFGRQRLGVEFGFPMLQSLDGPQLELDWWLQVGWRWRF